MNAITNLEIIRFQGHKATGLSLHPNVNIILGPSDVGKSSIIRALNWVVTNRPTGDSFCSNFGKGDTEVGVEFADDTYVVRRKGAKVNDYDADGKALKALRSDVPSEVHELTRMEEVNIQSQHKSYFMLEETPGQVAKMFNKVAGLEEMDEALKLVNGKVRAISIRTDFIKEEIASVEESLSGLDWVAAADKSLEAIEVFQSKLTFKRAQAEAVNNQLTKIEVSQSGIDDLPDISGLDDIETILEYDAKICVKADRYNDIEDTCKLLGKLRAELNRYNVLAELDLSQTAEICEDINEAKEGLAHIKSLVATFQRNFSEMLAIETHIDYCIVEVGECEKRCVKCKTCGQVLPYDQA